MPPFVTLEADATPLEVTQLPIRIANEALAAARRGGGGGGGGGGGEIRIEPAHALRVVVPHVAPLEDHRGDRDPATEANALALARLALEGHAAEELVSRDDQVRSIHWSPYDRVGEVDADP
tara:strand:+ start:153 stop:515 length:363 start_codon:yes stop_codon:yes gene_type:complete